MKRKFVRNYYSKLTLICFTTVFLLTFIVLVLIFQLQKNSRITSEIAKYDEILAEMEEHYNDIWKEFYKPLSALYMNYNENAVLDFVKGEVSGYDRERVDRNFEIVLSDMCGMDDRILAIYFRRLADGTRYIYFTDKMRMETVGFAMENSGIEEDGRRSVLGGRALNINWKKEEKPKGWEDASENVQVFGIQSQIFSAEKNAGEYQFTILYDLSVFDEIVANYDTNADVRFLLITRQGMIIYDSFGEYDYNQGTSLCNVDQILDSKGAITEDQVTHLKNVRSIKNGKYFACYLVAQNSLNGFQLDRMGMLMLLVAIVINVIMLICMLLINRLIGRKFCEMEKGINQIRKSNLKHRLSAGDGKDEFSRISECFNQMCDELEGMIEKNYVYQLLQRNAEYKALQTSINPHFLYNSLEAVRVRLTKNGQEDEAEMLLLLSRIFEYQIRGDNTVSIRRELDSLRNNIDFYSIRYNYAFEYTVDFDTCILDYRIPKHIFQPILENYFVHGYRNDGTDQIFILGYLDESDHMIHFCFCDNGKGMSGESIRELTASLEEDTDDNSHVGLRNVYARLKIACGKNSRIEIVSNAPDPGISISLVIERGTLEI